MRRSILTVCALVVLMVGSCQSARAWDCDAKGQHLASQKSHEVTFQPNASASISSGDLQVCAGDEMRLSLVSCRVGDSDPNGNVVIGQLSATVRWFDASNNVLGAVTLPTTGPIDQDLFPSGLFYTSAFSASPPMEFDLGAVSGADHMAVRCTGILMNQSSMATKVILAIDASYVGHGH